MKPLLSVVNRFSHVAKTWSLMECQFRALSAVISSISLTAGAITLWSSFTLRPSGASVIFHYMEHFIKQDYRLRLINRRPSPETWFILVWPFDSSNWPWHSSSFYITNVITRTCEKYMKETEDGNKGRKGDGHRQTPWTSFCFLGAGLHWCYVWFSRVLKRRDWSL